MSSTRLFNQFTQETLETIAASQFKYLPEKKSDLVKDLKSATDTAGVKELANMLKNLELEDVCNRYLRVEHAPGNNAKARPVLTKRLVESFEDEGLEGWFDQCDDKEVLGTLCDCLGIEFNSKSPLATIKTQAIKEIRNFGAQILLSRLSVAQLKTCCEEMNLEGYETSNSKRALIAAIITQSPVVKSAAPRQKVITKKRPIEKCSTYDELYQHYPAKALEYWCEQNSLKTYGTKKDLINRILEHLAGDKENIVVVPAAKLPTGSKAAKAEKPKAKGRGKKKAEEDDDEEADDEARETTKASAKPKTRAARGKKAKQVAEEEPADDEEDQDDEKPAEKPAKDSAKTKAKSVRGRKPAKVEEPADDEEEVDEELADDEEEAPVEKPVSEEETAKPAKAKSAKTLTALAEADEEPAEKPKATRKGKKPAKVEEEKPVSEEEEPAKDEEAPADDEYDEEAEQRAIDAERALRTTDDQESELELQESESEDVDHPKSLEGVCLHIVNNPNVDMDKIASAVEKARGKYSAKLTKSVNVLVTSTKNVPKFAKKLPNVKVVDETYLRNIL